MTTPVLLDTETTSACDLKTAGSRAYGRHSTTRLMCLCYRIGDCWGTYVPGDWGWSLPRHVENVEVHRTVPGALLTALHDHGAAAHNTSFDRHIVERFIGPVKCWTDSLHLARAAGLPGKLDLLSKYLGTGGKDKVGSTALKKMYTLAWDGKAWSNRFIAPGLINVLIRYCLKDVQDLADVLQFLAPHPYHDPGAREIDWVINSRGVGFDEELAAKIAEISRDLVAEAVATVEDITGGELRGRALNSGPQMHKWLKGQGAIFADLTADTVDRFLDDPVAHGPEEGVIPDVVYKVLRLRKVCLRVTTAKLERASAACLGGRIYDQYLYHGAGPGRWSSVGVQIHNLTSGNELVDIPKMVGGLTLESVRAEATRIGCSPDDVLSTLIRPCFVPSPGHSLIVSDFAAVEARGLEYLAQDEEGLEHYRQNLDPYKVFAAKLYNIDYAAVTKMQRKIAKVPVLGCGYRMGGAKLAAYAAGMGVDLSDSGFTSQELVDLWRDAHPLIAGERSGLWNGFVIRRGGLWKAMEEGFKGALSGITTRVGHIQFRSLGGSILMRLPSGRCITYRRAGVEERVPPWGGDPKPTLVYCSPKFGMIPTHGGLLTENCWVGDTRVLTTRGVVPMVDVVSGDFVWDGVDWVQTQGCVVRGTKEVGTWLGESVTADHLITDGSTWKPVAAAEEQFSRTALLYARSSAPIPNDPYPEATHPDTSWWFTGSAAVYDLANCGPRNRFTIITDYGPVIVHNCVQGMCRDPLKDGLIEAEAQDLRPVLHTHDEIGAEVPVGTEAESLDKLVQIMSKSPQWAPTLPLSAEGHSGPRYTKTPWPGYPRS